MRRTAVLAALGLVWSGSAQAAEPARAGQPVCPDPLSLRQHIVASFTKDERWLRSLACVAARPGASYEVIERGEEDDGAAMPKVRLVQPDGTTTEGFTLVEKRK